MKLYTRREGVHNVLYMNLQNTETELFRMYIDCCTDTVYEYGYELDDKHVLDIARLKKDEYASLMKGCAYCLIIDLGIDVVQNSFTIPIIIDGVTTYVEYNNKHKFEKLIEEAQELMKNKARKNSGKALVLCTKNYKSVDNNIYMGYVINSKIHYITLKNKHDIIQTSGYDDLNSVDIITTTFILENYLTLYIRGIERCAPLYDVIDDSLKITFNGKEFYVTEKYKQKIKKEIENG